MGLAKDFNGIIEGQLNVQAAWLPVTNTFALGDYGIISDGVFVRIGNISEFAIPFERAKGNTATIDFTSSDVRIFKLAGGAEVNVIPAGAVDAKVTLKFQKERSFVVKAPVINVMQMQNVQQVAQQLKKVDGWRRVWKVVFQVYETENALVLSNVSADTEVSFDGEVSALNQLKLANAGLGFSATKALGLDVHGQQGIIALGLFKLNLFGNVHVLSEDEKQKSVDVEIINGIPEDDL